jgi:predicted protein tyrosine phosphatase
MHVLFLCNEGGNRSRTAAEIFSERFTTASAGLYSDRPITERQLSQADLIIVMEEQHRTELARRFPAMYLHKRILVLGIPCRSSCVGCAANTYRHSIMHTAKPPPIGQVFTTTGFELSIRPHDPARRDCAKKTKTLSNPRSRVRSPNRTSHEPECTCSTQGGSIY